MRKQRENLRELSLLWNGVMNRCRTLYEHIPRDAALPLSDSEISILRMIGNNRRIVVGDITKFLSLPKSTVTGLITRLERKQLIIRKIYPDDLRSYVLELTEGGENAIRDYDRFEEIFFSRLFEPLTESESKALLDLLRNMISKGG